MKNCEFCDYYQPIIRKQKNSLAGAHCTFTNIVLLEGDHTMENDYLCKDISYQDYLERHKVRFALSNIQNEYWRLLYRH